MIGIAKNASGDYENWYLQQSLSSMVADATGIACLINFVIADPD
jgi:hypothetical protein